MLGVLGAALSLQPASQPVLRLVVLVIQAHLRRLRRHPRHISSLATHSSNQLSLLICFSLSACLSSCIHHNTRRLSRNSSLSLSLSLLFLRARSFSSCLLLTSFLLHLHSFRSLLPPLLLLQLPILCIPILSAQQLLYLPHSPHSDITFALHCLPACLLPLLPATHSSNQQQLTTNTAALSKRPTQCSFNHSLPFLSSSFARPGRRFGQQQRPQ